MEVGLSCVWRSEWGVCSMYVRLLRGGDFDLCQIVVVVARIIVRKTSTLINSSNRFLAMSSMSEKGAKFHAYR